MNRSFWFSGLKFFKHGVIAILIGLVWTVPAVAAPTISAISDQTIDEDTSLDVTFFVGPSGSTGGTGGFPFLPVNPTPGDNASINVTVTANNHILVPDSGIILSKDGSNHNLKITPAEDQSGQATIYITADDGSYSTIESFLLTVTGLNDAPVAEGPEDQEMDEDGVLTFNASNNNGFTVSDADAGDSIVEASIRVLNGTLTASNSGSVTVTGNGSPDLILSGSIARINTELNGLEYRPNSDWNGEDTLTLTINDKGNTGKGTGTGSPFPFPLPGGGISQSDTATLKITVLPVEDPLSLELPSEIVENAEDTTLTFNSETGPAIRIIDADGPFGDFKVAFRVEGPATVSIPDSIDIAVIVDYDGVDDLLLQGTLPDIHAALSGLMIEPEPDWHGELKLGITATDLTSSDTRTGVVTILVQPVNDAPVLEEGALHALSPVQMNDPNPAGDKIADITGSTSTDPDDPEEALGIAVINTDGTHGMWEFSTDNGGSWNAFEEASDEENAMLLNSEAMVRFVPVSDWVGVTVIEFRTWDQTADSSDTTENGGATPFSTHIGTASVTVHDEAIGPILTAIAGNDLNVSEGDSVYLDGSASRISDELTVIIQWSQLNGPEVTLANDGTLQPAFKAPNVTSEGADLEFELTISDDLGRTRSDRVIVRVFNNDQMRADAGPDQVVEVGEVVILNAAASFFPDENIPFYDWDQTSGGPVVISSPNSEETTFIAPLLDGADSLDLEFLLTISDNNGRNASDSVKIRVIDSASNQSPSANPGSDRTVTGGSVVTLDGSGSSDPDGSIVTYRWESLTDGSLILTLPEAAVTTFTAPVAETQDKILEFRLTVTDNEGLSASRAVKVTVSKKNDIPSGPGQGTEIALTADEGRTVTLNSGNFDSGSVYSWRQTSGMPMVTLSDTASPSPTFIAPSVNSAGTVLQFELIVDAADGNRHRRNYRVVIRNNGITGFPDDALSFHLFNGSAMGIKVSGNGTLVKLESIDPAEIDDNRNRPASLPYGLIDMVIKVFEPGDTVNVHVYPRSPASTNFTWFKYSEADGWEDYSAHSHMKPDGTEITVFLADGGPGDTDNATNGLIVDPSGPAQASSASSGGGGDDGGCFIRTMTSEF